MRISLPFKILPIFIVSSLFFISLPCFAEEQQSFESVEERRIFAQINAEKKKIEESKKEILIRENELKSLEASVDKKLAEIDTKIGELKALQAKIQTLLVEKDAQEQQKRKELSAIYEKMDPLRAAMAMTAMDQELAADLLRNMKPKSAAKILNMLEKTKTSQLSTTFTTIPIE